MKKHLLIPYFLLLPFILFGQSEEELEIIQFHQEIYKGMNDDKPTPNYLFPIALEDSLINICKGSKFESLAYQSLSWYNSYVGNYRRSLELYAKTLESKALKTDDLIDLTKFKPVNAKDQIVSKSKSYDFILINESHHKPQHRLFVQTILKDLFENDYKILAIEGIGINDTIINQTKMPTKELGGLTMEPYYSDLIRHALKIGFEIFPYDYDTEFDFVKRDSLGAHRIVKHQNETGQKVLVFCGYEHIDKTQKSLAYWIKEYSNTTVLSVNQSRYSEEFERQYESPYYQMATSLLDQDRPYLLKKKKEDFKEDESADLFVIHPRTSYKNNIASWQINYDENKSLVTFPKGYIPEIKELSVVQVFYASEYDRGIPLTQFIYDPNEAIRIAIPQGEYTLKIERKDRKELFKVDFNFELPNGISIVEK